MIEQIRIQNFKSIADVTVRLSETTVLVGRSGTGKSNFVEAVRCLRDLLIGQSRNSRDGPIVRPLPKTDAATAFEVVFSIDGVDSQYRYELIFESDTPQGRPSLESLHLGDNCVFHQGVDSSSRGGLGGGGFAGGFLGATWKVEPSLVEVPNADGIMLGKLPSLTEAVIAYTALTEGIACYAFPNSVMTVESGYQASSSGFDDVGSNYLETMKRIVSDIRDLSGRRRIVAALQRVSDGVASVELNDLQQPQHAIVGHRFNGKTLGLNLSRESEGFRRFFAHLLALYQKPPKLLMLFEHPEDGIHPGALSLLADEFNAAPREGRGQVLLTTHSPGLLDNFAAKDIRVVEREGFHTRIGPLDEGQLESINEDLLKPGELLTVDPARSRGELVSDTAE